MITGTTRLAGVIGDPVRHSLSPVIHNAAFIEAGLDWVFLALPVASGQASAAVEAMRSLRIEGLSVTMPHKADVAAAVDDLTPEAKALGVCNCLFWRRHSSGRDQIVGHSTDGDGFVWDFERRFGCSLAGLDVLVVGAGGAARSIVEALGRAQAASIGVSNRTPDRARSVAALAQQAEVVTNDRAAVEAADVVVNTTPVGMRGGPDPDGVPVPVEALRPGQRVVDIVYDPRQTPLLQAATSAGAETADGVGMLVGQAALAFELWTGRSAPIEAMANAVAT